MPKYTAHYVAQLSVAVTVEADDEDHASELSWNLAEEYAQTLVGTSQGVVADATFDGVGAYEIEEKA